MLTHLIIVCVFCVFTVVNELYFNIMFSNMLTYRTITDLLLTIIEQSIFVLFSLPS